MSRMATCGIELRFFEPSDEHFVIERRHLPHWAQAGTVCFITWRTWDSMPRDAVESWVAARDAWLRKHGIDPRDQSWHARLRRLPLADQQDFHEQISARWEAHLDEGHGECVLRRPELASIVANSLCHFDGERYLLTDFVVMPNHVHILAAFLDPEGMLRQCDSWKHYTATQLNRALGRSGRFWQVDGFDHLVRSAEQFEHLRQYVADNPHRARLREGEYVHYSKDLGAA
jgi:putative transposase